MCGRFTLTLQLEEWLARFGQPNFPAAYGPRYNIAPGQMVPIIAIKQNQRKAALLRWGLVPPWAKDSKIGYKMINARSESVSAKPSFRDAFASKRCLIPADGFYEWIKTEKGKQPFHIRFTDQPIFAMAGLYQTWHDPETNQPLHTFTILTTNANKALEDIHERMPVILQTLEAEEQWLHPDTKREQLEQLLQPYPDAPTRFKAVSDHVNTAKLDEPSLLDPI